MKRSRNDKEKTKEEDEEEEEEEEEKEDYKGLQIITTIPKSFSISTLEFNIIHCVINERVVISDV